MLWLLRYRATLDGARRSYEKGMHFFRTPGGPSGTYRGRSEFYGFVAALTTDPGGERNGFLFEEIGDNEWAYRCDDMTKLFALSAYRLATIGAEAGSERRPGYFCEALRARPDVILPLVKEEGLSPKAGVAFQQALSDPRCYFEDGYRGAPYTAFIKPDSE